MSKEHATKKALEILADPAAKEHDWMLALRALGGKAPALSKRNYADLTVRFAQRVAGLTVLYSALFASAAALDALFFSHYALYGITEIAAIAFLWAILETCAGLCTLYALSICLFSFSRLITLDPVIHTVWMIILINMFVYARGRWRPYVTVPIRALIYQNRPRKFNRSLTSVD